MLNRRRAIAIATAIAASKVAAGQDPGNAVTCDESTEKSIGYWELGPAMVDPKMEKKFIEFMEDRNIKLFADDETRV